MNKFLLLLGLSVLLAGCGEPAKNQVITLKEPAKQSAPVEPIQPSTTPAASENKATAENSAQTEQSSLQNQPSTSVQGEAAKDDKPASTQLEEKNGTAK